MREAKFWAGLGTILVFIGIYCFKALYTRNVSKEELAERGNTSIKNGNKIILVLSGSVAILIGVLLLVKSFKMI